MCLTTCTYWLLLYVILTSFFHADGYVNSTLNNFVPMSEDHLNKFLRREDQKFREPRFLTFDTKDNNIEVEINFAIPFLSVPVKRTMNAAQSVINGVPLANLNLGAVILAASVAIGGVILSTFATNVAGGAGLSQAFGNFFKDLGIDDVASGQNSTDRNFILRTRAGDSSTTSALYKLFNLLDQAFQKYDIDATACLQKALCSAVRNASINVARGRGTSMEKILDGITSIEWIMKFTSGTAIEDAIRMGRHRLHCEGQYLTCTIDVNSLEDFIEIIAKKLNII